MTAPTKNDLLKLEQNITKKFKTLNPDGSPKRPMDENRMKGLFRSAVRKEWMFCNTKLSFLLSKRIPDMDVTTRTKWIHECNICGNRFKEGDVQVDHIKGENGFTQWDGAEGWADVILNTNHENLQILCTECHKTKTRCEQLGLDWRSEQDWNTTRLEQEFTSIVKSKAKGQKEFIESHGGSPGGNETERKAQIRNILWRINASRHSIQSTD